MVQTRLLVLGVVLEMVLEKASLVTERDAAQSALEDLFALVPYVSNYSWNSFACDVGIIVRCKDRIVGGNSRSRGNMPMSCSSQVHRCVVVRRERDDLGRCGGRTSVGRALLLLLA